MSAPDARRVALEVLIRVASGAPSDRTLDRGLRGGGLPERDRGLATELVYGVLRRRQSLDRRIAEHSKRPLDDLDSAVLEALRIGVYQIAFLDRIPAHAAVAATVDAVKAHNPGAGGFVNAILRNVVRAGGTWADPAGGGPCRSPGAPHRSPDGPRTVDSLADIPAWWAERWQRRFGGRAAAAWFDATLRPAPLALRAHPRRVPHDDLPALLAGQGVETAPSTLVSGALRVVSGNPVGAELLRQSAFALRSEGSQLVASLLPAKSSDRVLDACAGRGGKTLQIAEDARPRLIVATDVSSWRLADCAREARFAGVAEVRPVVADLSGPAPFSRCFSAVLVDTPCSGLGTVRRHPEVKWRNDPARLRRLAGLQRRILANAADTLTAGGSLLYVTCSTEPEENEEVVAAVLEQRQDLERRPVELPAGADRRLVGADGYFRTYPGFVDLDGFFAALLVKTR